MFIPLNLVPASGTLWQDESLDLGSLIAGPVAMGELEHFQQLMADQGISVQPTRMIYDRLYAFERLAKGHASGHDELRELSLTLFESYQSAGEWIGLIH
ncbi:hypothetical protein [Pelomonas sp. SE-A7]|uniref:hypothetical protein n=1 Tax=Pelomonas sp. SE-A7 TaxID=3054953 RepID=UPI00259C8FAE|nr:hypothetical protein [Pelomonas sp. SE-A7]MDM4765927.1 hypothetical protein [Pelomonas sp. SE-A7]